MNFTMSQETSSMQIVRSNDFKVKIGINEKNKQGLSKNKIQLHKQTNSSGDLSNKTK